jgi:methyl-accepting chemotaxis protein
MSHTADSIDLDKRLEFLGVDRETRERLRKLKPVVDKAIGPALEAFYERVAREPQTARFFSNPAHMAAAAQRQRQHWMVIAAAEYDGNYGANVRAIGNAHARLGLEPRWYIGGYALVVERLIAAVLQEQWPRLLRRPGEGADETAKLIGALVKAAMLDMDLAISTYLDALDAARKKAEAKSELVQQNQAVAVKSLGEALSRLAEGDLKVRLDSALAPEFDELKHNFNSTTERMERTIGAVAASIHANKTSMAEIATASEDLARRTEQQAAALEEATATLAEVTGNIAKTSSGVERASTVVGQAKDDASAGGEIMRRAVVSMEKIEGSSKDIERIIGVIDEIAFQTNLLALNAGVEAARAGDSGRGFAVVASEVRALAQRSAEAAKEIKSLITASSAQVAEGGKLVNETQGALEGISRKVDEITKAIAVIVQNAAEQSQRLRDISQVVDQIDQITQKNAAMAEEATAASRLLTQDTEKLAAQISVFRAEDERPDVARFRRALR